MTGHNLEIRVKFSGQHNVGNWTGEQTVPGAPKIYENMSIFSSDVVTFALRIWHWNLHFFNLH